MSSVDDVVPDTSADAMDFDRLRSPNDGAPDYLLAASRQIPEPPHVRQHDELFHSAGAAAGDRRTGAALRDAPSTTNKADLKNSRRKMDKPRKRKRTADSDVDAKVHKSSPAAAAGRPAEGAAGKNRSGRETADSTAAGAAVGQPSESNCNLSSNVGRRPAAADLTSSSSPPLPEDLSTVKAVTDSTGDGDSQLQSDSPPILSAETVHDPWSSVGGGGASTSDGGYSGVGGISAAEAAAAATGSSVHDLEAAMNKHLPVAMPTGIEQDHQSPGGCSGYGQLAKNRSTIQWIGGHSPSSAMGGGGGGGSDLSASSLLRSLYPNRESVIRTNVYSTRPQYYADIQNVLLTPPGGTGCGGGGIGGGGTSAADLYRDSFATSLLGHHHHHHSKTPPSGVGGGTGGYGLVNGCYAPSPLGVSMAAANMADAYAMTPPSSVSPQESYAAAQFLDHLQHSDATAAAMMQQYCVGGGVGGGMPIKPQAYSLPSAHGGGGGGGGGVGGSGSYEHSSLPYHHHSGYYPSNVGLAAYNCMSTANVAAANHYRDAMKNANAW